MRAVEPPLESRPQTETSVHRDVGSARWAALRPLAVALGAAWLALPLGCKDTTCRGVLTANGCEAPCRNEDCAAGERCVENLCTPKCSSDADCQGGSCERTRADDGTTGKFCSGGHSAAADDDASDDDDVAPPEGQCTQSRQCDEATGQRCVAGVCRLTCELHAHCGGAGACADEATDVEGNAVHLCRFDDFPRGEGEYGSSCPNGNGDCAEGFRCIGAGEGDASAYCTATGCDDDEDCPTGLYCSRNRTAAPPCEDACGRRGVATERNCVPGELIGDGRPYRCAGVELELHICLARGYCADCDTDADCRSLPGQVCARGGDGTKSCSMLCDPGTNSCPWGSASSCQVWDERLGVPTCGHRAGSCHGDGSSCAPCVDDRDCPKGFCSFNSFTSEQFCVDESVVCACDEGDAVCLGGGCPETPGGLTMNCVSRGEGAPPDACYGAPTVAGDETSALGCWPREPQ